jgi:hypothetical protein
MTLSDRIELAQNELLAKKDQLVDLTKSLEDTPDDDTLLAQVDDLTAQVEKAVKYVDTLKKAEATLAEKVKSAAPAIVHSTKKADGELWVKNATIEFLAHVQRKTPDQVIAERYEKDAAIKAVRDVTKTAVPVATTFTAGWAQELVQNDTRGFLDLLTPTSVAAALASRSMMVNFDGYDSVTIPRRNTRAAGTTLGGAFVGEGGAIPLGRISVGSTKLSRFKMAVISTFTRELAERSTPSIEAVIRQAILDDTSIMLDSVFLGSAAAVAGIQPAGITNGVTATTGTTGGGVDAVVADIKAGVAALTNAGLGVRPVLLVNTRDAMSVGLMTSPLGEFMFQAEMNGNRLLGIEVVKSLNVPQGTAILLDASALATAFDMTMFDVSDVATVVEANADTNAPTHSNGTAGQVAQNGGIPVLGAATGGAVATGATARSLWQTYSVGVRAVTPVSWGVLQPNAVVHFTGLSW